MLLRNAPSLSHLFSDPAGSSSDRNFAPALANPSADKRCSIPGSRCSPASARGSVREPEQFHFHISFGVVRVHRHEATHTEVSIDPKAGRPLSLADLAA